MRRRWESHRSTAAAALWLAATACSGSSNPSEPTITEIVLRATATDAAGDAVARPSVATSPDLIRAVAEVRAGIVAFSVEYAPGTLSQADTYLSVMLDMDENAQTGSPGIDAEGTDAALIGADYLIAVVSPRASQRLQLLIASGPNQFTPIVSTTVLFPNTSTVLFSLPLSLLGGDDGRFRFVMNTAQWLTDTTVTGITDHMPNAGSVAVVVR